MRNLNDELYDLRQEDGWGVRTNKSQYMLTQAIASSDFPDFITEVMDAGVQSAFLDTLVGRELCTFEQMESPVKSWMREEGFNAASFIGEGVEPPMATIRHSKFTVRPVKIGMGMRYTQESLEDLEMGMVGRHLNKIGRAIARSEDKYIMYNLMNMVADGSSDYKSGDYVTNHILDATDADWAVSGTLDHEKFAVAVYIMEKEGFDISHVVMSPAQRAQWNILNAYLGIGSNTPAAFAPGVSRGIKDSKFKTDLGLPGGAELVISNTIDDDKVLFLDKENYARFYERRGLMATVQPRTPNEIYKSTWTERVACAVTEPASAVLLQNLDYINPDTFSGA
jgi:hypothetical protein